jgi:hypothetical protein
MSADLRSGTVTTTGDTATAAATRARVHVIITTYRR